MKYHEIRMVLIMVCLIKSLSFIVIMAILLIHSNHVLSLMVICMFLNHSTLLINHGESLKTISSVLSGIFVGITSFDAVK